MTKCKKIVFVLVVSFFMLSGFYNLSDFAIGASFNEIKEGSLIRSKEHSEVFIISKGAKRRIPNIEIFNSYGYEWDDVIEVDQSVELSYDLTRLIKANNEKVYYLANNKKLWIPSPEIFLSAGYKSVEDEVIVINEAELNYYKNLKLVRKRDKISQGLDWSIWSSDQTVFIITSFGTKRPIRNAEIFESYDFSWRDIRGIPTKLLDAFPDTILVRAKEDYKVYKIENGMKYWIIDQNAFISNGFKFSQIEEATALDLGLYLEGKPIE